VKLGEATPASALELGATRSPRTWPKASREASTAAGDVKQSAGSRAP
jgi:hypothetical protein